MAGTRLRLGEESADKGDEADEGSLHTGTTGSVGLVGGGAGVGGGGVEVAGAAAGGSLAAATASVSTSQSTAETSGTYVGEEAVFETTSVLPPLVEAVELTVEELPVGVTKVNCGDCARMPPRLSALATRLTW